MLRIIKFSAEWCGPCKVLNPIFDKMIEEFDNIEFVKVDVDNNPNIAKDYNIVSIPTTIFIKGGRLVDSIVGLCDENELRSKIKGWLI